MSDEFDPTVMRAVALAYRAKRQAGKMDGPAMAAALRAYRLLVPGTQEDCGKTVSAMLCAAINRDPAWFWRNMPSRWPPPPDAYLDDVSP